MATPLRIPIVETVEPRQPDVNKDGLAKNIFYDINARNETFATKRPGLEVFITGSGSPIGSSEYAWGIYNYELPVREIVNGNIVIGDPINLLFDFSQMTQGSNSSIGMGISKFPPVSNPAPGALPTPEPALPNPDDLDPPPEKVPVTEDGDPETGEGGSSVISNSTAAPVPVTAPTPIYIDPKTGASIWGDTTPIGNPDPLTWRLYVGSGEYQVRNFSCTGTATPVVQNGIQLLRTETNVEEVTFSPLFTNTCNGPNITHFRWLIEKTDGSSFYYTPYSATVGYMYFTMPFYTLVTAE